MGEPRIRRLKKKNLPKYLLAYAEGQKAALRAESLSAEGAGQPAHLQAVSALAHFRRAAQLCKGTMNTDAKAMCLAQGGLWAARTGQVPLAVKLLDEAIELGSEEVRSNILGFKAGLQASGRLVLSSEEARRGL